MLTLKAEVKTIDLKVMLCTLSKQRSRGLTSRSCYARSRSRSQNNWPQDHAMLALKAEVKRFDLKVMLCTLSKQMSRNLTSRSSQCYIYIRGQVIGPQGHYICIFSRRSPGQVIWSITLYAQSWGDKGISYLKLKVMQYSPLPTDEVMHALTYVLKVKKSPNTQFDLKVTVVVEIDFNN